MREITVTMPLSDYEAMKREINRLQGSVNRMYSQEYLLKAIEYACEMQKAEDYQKAGSFLVGADNQDDAIEKTLNYLCDTDVNIAKTIDFKEIELRFWPPELMPLGGDSHAIITGGSLKSAALTKSPDDGETINCPLGL